MIDSNAVELNAEQLTEAAGGMKWDHNYVSPNVIDARGGYTTFFGITFTFDVNGGCSSVSYTG